MAIDYGLSSVGILTNWIHDYKKNGYNVVEKPRGRPRKSTVNQKKIKLSNEQKKVMTDIAEEAETLRGEQA